MSLCARGEGEGLLSDSWRTDSQSVSVSEASGPSESDISMGFSIELPDSGGVTRMGYKAADGGVAGVSSDIMDGDLVDLKKKKFKLCEPAVERGRNICVQLCDAIPTPSLAKAPQPLTGLLIAHSAAQP